MSNSRDELGRQQGPVEDRRRPFTFLDQLRLLRPILLCWTVGCIVLVSLTLQDSSGDFLLDPSQIADQPWYTGIVLKLTMTGWALGAGIALGAAWFARVGRRPGAARFLAGAAAISVIMLADEALFLRSKVLPALGAPPMTALVVFMLPVVAFIAMNIKEINRTRTHLLQACVIALGVSLLVNALVVDRGFEPARMYEAGSRFLAVIAWIVYLVATGRDIATSILGSNVTAVSAAPTGRSGAAEVGADGAVDGSDLPSVPVSAVASQR